MVSFPKALDLLLENCPPAVMERVRLEDAVGRVLRETVKADRDFPAFDRVMMDGHALRVADWENGCRKFRVTGSAPAGAVRVDLSGPAGDCLEVMTGAPCPGGADGIVPVEEVIGRGDGWVEFGDAARPQAGQFIHRAGSDAAAGEVLLEPGVVLGSRAVGVAASCGAAWLTVSKLPRIAVIATGDELVAVDEIPGPHQIRQSNGHSLAAALQRAGYPSEAGVLGDDLAAAGPALAGWLAGRDWLILTGAVSMGARDFVPQVLGDAGCRKIFHGVSQRPGKPAGCWIGPDGQVIVALPGNPVAALTGLHALVLPALAAAAGGRLPLPSQMSLIDPTLRLDGFTRHLPVILRPDGQAEPAPTGNSGDFIGLLRSDGFVTLPPRGEGDSVSAAAPFTPWL